MADPLKGGPGDLWASAEGTVGCPDGLLPYVLLHSWQVQVFVPRYLATLARPPRRGRREADQVYRLPTSGLQVRKVSGRETPNLSLPCADLHGAGVCSR